MTAFIARLMMSFFPPWKIVLSIFLVIAAFAFTLGSGGSGGVFGPSLVVGGLTGASVYFFLKDILLFPESSTFNLTAFTVVGMVSTFAAAAKAPLSTIILVAEITGGYQLLIPATIAVAVSHFLSGEKSIFKSQVDTKLDSPVHYDEFKYMLLNKYLVRDVMEKRVITISPDASILFASKFMDQHSISALPVGVAPVVNDPEEKILIGIISDYDIGKVLTGRA